MPKEGPTGVRSAWPETVQEVHEAYGWNVATYSKDRPTAKEIDRLDRFLPMLYALDDPYKTIVAGRMMGESWVRISHKIRDKGFYRSGHQELKESFVRGLEALYSKDKAFFKESRGK